MSVATAIARMSPFLAPCHVVSSHEGTTFQTKTHLHDSSPKRNPLSASTNRVSGILHVRSLDDTSVCEKY